MEKILLNLDTMRVSSDIWDNWSDVGKLFKPAKTYAQYSSTGHYLDLDMLPFGTLKNGTQKPYYQSTLTHDQIKSSFGLHLIARSSLIMGGSLLNMDSSLEELLTNKEAIEVNQCGTNEHCFYDAQNITKWVSNAEDNSKYVALFNRTGEEKNIPFKFSDIELSGTCMVRNIWDKRDEGEYTSQYAISVPAFGCALLKVTTIDKEEYDNIVSGNIYTFTNVMSGKNLDNLNSALDGNQVGQYTINDKLTQKWKVTETEDGYYTLQNQMSNLYLECNSTTNGFAVCQRTYTESDCQKWEINKIESNIYTLTCKYSGKNLDNGNKLENSQCIIQFKPNSDLTQQWKMQ